MLLPAADGSIELLGAPAERLVPRERDAFRARAVG
jgi:hypothetical protein